MDLNWIPCANDVSLPAHAVMGGNDVDGDVIYVGRANHSGNTLVAKVIPAKRKAYVSWLGQEIVVHRFEVLCSQSCVWKHCYNHHIPDNAVICGKTSLGQSVYIGRGHHEGSLTVGRISSVHRSLFIPFRNAEHRLESYDILLTETRGYPEEKPGMYPAMPVPLPMPMPMPQPMPMPMPMPMPIQDPMPTRTPPPPYGPTAPAYEQPVPNQNFTPATVYTPPPPRMGSPVGVYNPTGVSSTNDTWVTAAGNYVPPGAVVGGHDSDGSVLYVCRAMHEGFYIPGKAAPHRGCCYIGYHGMEIMKHNYEILAHNNEYQWVPGTGNHLPAGAVVGGHTRNSEPLYVGRSTYQGSLTPGYVQRSENCLHISYGGQEHRLYSFEYLVHKSHFQLGVGMF